LYQNVRDSYSSYVFKEKAEAPFYELCQSKEYILSQLIIKQKRDLSETGAYRLEIRLADGLENETYVDQILDFLHSAKDMPANFTLVVEIDGSEIFVADVKVLPESNTDDFTYESILQQVSSNRRLNEETGSG